MPEGTEQVADQATEAPAEPGTESEADADVQTPGTAADTETEEQGWTPTWRQQQGASRSGLSDADVASLVETLGPERAAEFLDARAEQHDAISRQASGFGPQGHEAPPNPAEAAAEGVPDGEFALPPQLFDQTWDNPEVVAPFFKPFVDEMNQMRKAIRALGGRVQSASDRNAAITADTFFASLGEEYEDVFGTGPTNVRSMEPQHVARRRVMDSADKIAEGFRRSGNPIHPREALERALSMEMGEKLGTIARNRRQARLKTRAGQTSAAPGGRRKAKPVTREQRKEKFVRGADKILAGEPYKRP